MSDGVRVTKLTSSIGARVEDVDLSRDVCEEVQLELQQALWQNFVLVFPGRNVGLEEQIRLVSCFAEVQPMPVFRFLGERDPAIAIDYTAGGVMGRDGRTKRAVAFNSYKRGPTDVPRWHTDVSFTPKVPLVGSLRAEVVSPVGGDTCFASLCGAYDALSPVMQDWLVNLNAVHAPPLGYKESINIWEYGEDAEARFDAEFPPREHPLVVEHPRSHRLALYVNPSFTERIAGMTDAESFTILRFLYTHSTAPSFVYRHHWSPGDIVVWDEFVCLHLAPTDFQANERRLIRIIGGTVTPVSPSPGFAEA